MDQNPYQSPNPVAPDPSRDDESGRVLVITVTTILVTGVIPTALLWFFGLAR